MSHSSTQSLEEKSLTPVFHKMEHDSETFFYDNNHVRFRKIKESASSPFNWLFFPGGPGADSCCLESLVPLFHFPANIWLVDLPGNGSNPWGSARPKNYDHWLKILVPTIQRFENPIYVGHSFGGMLPLLFPELEHILKGLVILNSAPSLWFKETFDCIKKNTFPDYKKKLRTFIVSPSLKNAQSLLIASIPHLISFDFLKDLYKIKNTPFSITVAIWWVKKALKTHYNAQWIPQKVPTLIVGSENDCITPFCIYESDKRFQAQNIQLHRIKNARHFSWMNQPEEIKKIIDDFYWKMIEKEKSNEKRAHFACI